MSKNAEDKNAEDKNAEDKNAECTKMPKTIITNIIDLIYKNA